MRKIIKFLRQKLKNFTKDKKGISAVAFGLMGMTAITITFTAADIGRYMELRSALQTLADLATTSAVTELTNRTARCQDIFNTGLKDAGMGDSATQGNSIFRDAIVSIPVPVRCTEHTDAASNTIEIRLTSKVKVRTYFSRGLGLDDLDITTKSSAISEKDPIEIVFGLSMQGTMCSKFKPAISGFTPEGTKYIRPELDPNCTKIDVIADSITYFVDKILRAKDRGNIQVGFVPFNYKVKFPNATSVGQIPPSLQANEDSLDPNFFLDFTEEEPLLPIRPLSTPANVMTAPNANGKTYLQNFSEQGNELDVSRAWGRTDLPMHTMALMLDPTQKAFFNDHKVKDWKGGTNSAKKYVILLSDGANVGCCYTNHPTDNYENQYIYRYKPYKDHMLAVCKALKAKGVRIFTILVDADFKQTGGAENHNTMVRCATGPYADQSLTDAQIDKDDNFTLECHKRADCYSVNSADGIKAAYREIASRIFKSRISE